MTIAGQLRAMRVMHIALCVSVLIYLPVLWFAVSSPKGTEGATDPTIFVIVFGVLVASTQAVIPLLRRARMPPRLDDGAAIDLDRRLDEREQRALDRLRSVLILTWALCESCAIYGLTLGFVSFQFWYFPPFAAVGLGSMVLYAPSQALVASVVRGANG